MAIVIILSFKIENVISFLTITQHKMNLPPKWLELN